MSEQLLMSDDTPAAPSAESFDSLKQKHPQASLRAADLPCPSQDQLMSRQSDEQFCHFLLALLEVLMACARSTFGTCYSVERAGRSFSRISQLS